MELLHPGVYIEEVPGGVRPIEGVSTSTAAFLGQAERGPVERPLLTTSFLEFERNFGGFLEGPLLAQSVLQFFDNGGRRLYVVRVAPAATPASIQAGVPNRRDRVEGASAESGLSIAASSPGGWGNGLKVDVTDAAADPVNEFTLTIRRLRENNVVETESFAGLSIEKGAPNFVETVVNAQSGLVRVEGPAAAKGASRSGATPAVELEADSQTLTLSVNGDDSQIVTLSDAPLKGGTAIAAAIQAAVSSLKPKRPVVPEEAYKNFTAVFASGVYVLTSGVAGPQSSVAIRRSPTNDAAPSLNLGRLNGGTQDPIGTSISGASPASDLPADQRLLTLSVNGDEPQSVTLSGAVATGEEIAAALQAAVTNLRPRRPSTPVAAYEGFTAAFSGGVYVLTSGLGGTESSVRVQSSPSNDAAPLLQLGTHNLGTESTGNAVLRPAVGTYFMEGGSDGNTPGDAEYQNALRSLDQVSDVSILAVPGIGSRPVLEAGSSYCQQRKDCFFVGEMTPIDDTRDEARDYANRLTVKSSYAAVYFPWLKATDPTGRSAGPIDLPPSGFVCGMYARIDGRRGVWKAPAGTETNIAGAVGLTASISDTDQDVLNPIGVNVIRFFPASGIVVWGARTLATRSDPEYRYVPVRRFAIFLEQSIYNGIQWAVFEPNDEDLWASLRLNIGAFMMNLFRAGAFQGDTPAKAFFVKCDAETNPQTQIDAGIVTVLVGFAPLKPAEFVVVKISQRTAEAAV